MEHLDETLRTDANALTVADAFGQTRLHAAARQGRVAAVELLAQGADIVAVDRWGWTPLAAAVQSGKIDVARLLIARGADVNAKNNTGVIKAEGVNRFAVACTKKVYTAGIHPRECQLPVRLVFEQRTGPTQDTVSLGLE